MDNTLFNMAVSLYGEFNLFGGITISGVTIVNEKENKEFLDLSISEFLRDSCMKLNDSDLKRFYKVIDINKNYKTIDANYKKKYLPLIEHYFNESIIDELFQKIIAFKNIEYLFINVPAIELNYIHAFLKDNKPSKFNIEENISLVLLQDNLSRILYEIGILKPDGIYNCEFYNGNCGMYDRISKKIEKMNVDGMYEKTVNLYKKDLLKYPFINIITDNSVLTVIAKIISKYNYYKSIRSILNIEKFNKLIDEGFSLMDIRSDIKVKKNSFLDIYDFIEYKNLNSVKYFVKLYNGMVNSVFYK